MSRAKQGQLQRRIGEGELHYLKLVRAQAAEATACERRAAALDQEAQQLRTRAVALYGAHESYVGYLCERYGLDREADQIDPDSGEITRAPELELVGAPVDGPPVNGASRS